MTTTHTRARGSTPSGSSTELEFVFRSTMSEPLVAPPLAVRGRRRALRPAWGATTACSRIQVRGKSRLWEARPAPSEQTGLLFSGVPFRVLLGNSLTLGLGD